MNVLSLGKIAGIFSVALALVAGLFPNIQGTHDNAEKIAEKSTSISRTDTAGNAQFFNAASQENSKRTNENTLIQDNHVMTPSQDNSVDNSIPSGSDFSTTQSQDLYYYIQDKSDQNTVAIKEAGLFDSLSSNGFSQAKSSDAQKIINKTNSIRQSNGSKALTNDASLSQSATKWAEYLAGSKTFKHDYNEQTGSFRGENIYRSSAGVDATKAVSAWEKSPGHFKNMVDKSFTSTGVGIAYAPDNSVVVVQRFN